MTENYLQIHFLYGSKPNPKYKETEKKWFGGIMGGHAGIGVNDGDVLSFFKQNSLHIFPNNSNKHGVYKLTTQEYFYTYLGGTFANNQKVIIHIPLSNTQIETYKKLEQSYLFSTPYDYAFLGHRCASATYEMLVQLNILPKLSYWKTIFYFFYPKKLRSKILYLAQKNKWQIELEQGTNTRIWESDF